MEYLSLWEYALPTEAQPLFGDDFSDGFVPGA